MHQHRGVGALALERTHRMRCITDQPDVAIAYLLCRIAVVVTARFDGIRIGG